MLAPAADGSLNQIERQWAATGISASDTSYTQVEKNRGGAFSAAGDNSYTQVEKNRGGALTAPKVGGTAPGPGTSGFVPDYGPGTSGTVPGYGPGRIQGHRGAEIDQ